MKKLVILVFITLTVLTLFVIIIVKNLNTFKEPTDGLIAIPSDAFSVLKINDYHGFSESLRSHSLAWKSLKNLPYLSKADEILSKADSLLANNNRLNQLVSLNTLYLSLHSNTSEKKTDYFVSFILKKRFSKNDILSPLKNFKGCGIEEIILEGHDVTLLKSLKDRNTFAFITVEKGLFLMSSSDKMIISSIKQIKDGLSLKNDSEFNNVYQTAGSNVAANFIINYKKIPDILEHDLNLEFLKNIQNIGKSTCWTSLDLSVKKEELNLSGFSSTTPKTRALVSVIARQKPVDISLTSILPSQTSAFIWLGISDLNTYLEDFRSYLDKIGEINSYTNTLSQIKKDYGVDIHELFSTIFNKELALAFVPFDGVEPSRCWFAVSRIQSASQAEQIFENIITQYVNEKHLHINDFRYQHKIDSETTSTIYRIPLRSIHRALWGNMFDLVNEYYFTIINDYLIFADSTDVLKKFTLSNIQNNTLAVDLTYGMQKEMLASTSNFYFYVNPARSGKLFELVLNNTSYKKYISNITALKSIQGLTVQFTGGNDMVFNNIGIRHSQQVFDEPQAYWETKLDTLLKIKPQILTNHYTKKKEIFVQDEKNNIYLLNDVGRILWKRKLVEPIISDVKQIDLYKNGKLQIAFNTPKNIFVIDRNGNDVENFPIRLKSKATNSLAIFDYEQSKDYRFFVAGESNQLYAFNDKGKALKGWTFKKTESTVQSQLQHFRINGVDYILFADKNRIYVVDRKGNERIRYRYPLSVSKYGQFVYEEKTKKTAPRFVITDTLGIIYSFYFNGIVEKLPIKVFSSNHFFDFQDLDGDGNKDYIFLDGKTLTVYKQSKEIIFEYNFNFPLIPKVIYYNFGGSERKLGVATKEGNEIYLINASGGLNKGFPLQGNSLFSLIKSNNQFSFNLIVGSNSGSVLNYEVK